MDLARGCSIAQVERWLNTGSVPKLVDFLRKRHYNRFFDPIDVLKNTRQSHEGYGFSMMSLCCLLVETIQCFREGWPTTSNVEWVQLLRIQANEPVPLEYQLPAKLPTTGQQAFRAFFADHPDFFPYIDGDSFYDNIRNGLLHQAQTKDGWTINVMGSRLCEGKNINRNLFAETNRASNKMVGCLEQSLPCNVQSNRGRRNHLATRQTACREGSPRGHHRGIHHKCSRSQGSDIQPLAWPYLA